MSIEFKPDAEMFVCMDASGCYHVSWNEGQHHAKMESLGTTHGAAYDLRSASTPAKAVMVTDEMVERAHEAYAKTTGGMLEGHPMRKALTAALSALEDAPQQEFVSQKSTPSATQGDLTIARETQSAPQRQAGHQSTEARFSRLYGICRRIRWTDVGAPAVEETQTKSALTDLAGFLFMDGIDAALSDRTTPATGSECDD